MRPLVTFTTDFGLADAYVAQLKAAVLKRCPHALLIDVTHQVPRHDVLCGSITLERAVEGFFPGTVHVAVVDPGVGSDRRILVTNVGGQWVVCPDNGLITWTWRCHPGAKAYELTWRPPRASDVFHGRDIMAPAAAMLASGTKVTTIARPIHDPILLDIAPAPPGARQGSIIHIDHFGNATTNLPYAQIRRRDLHFRIRNKSIGRLRRTYWDVASGKPLALIGSSGLLEIAVRDGSAAEKLKLKVGDRVEIEPLGQRSKRTEQ
jgi:S-adenosylmethionine hydrolase